MGAGLKVVIPESNCNHLELGARFAMREFHGKPRQCLGPSGVFSPPSSGWWLPLAEDSAWLVLADAILLAADAFCSVSPVLGGSGLDAFQGNRRTMRDSCF